MGLPFSVTWCFSIEVFNMQWAFFVLFIWYFSCALFWFCLVSCEPFGSGWAMLPPPYLINLLLLFYWKYFLFLWHESFLCYHNSWILSSYMFLEILNVPLIFFLKLIIDLGCMIQFLYLVSKLWDSVFHLIHRCIVLMKLSPVKCLFDPLNFLFLSSLWLALHFCISISLLSSLFIPQIDHLNSCSYWCSLTI